MTSNGPSVAQLEALLAEQAALRRVATLVASDPVPARLFDGVCEEVGRVLGVESVGVVRFEDDEANALMTEALEHMESGIRDLRELAAGIHPSVLTDRGLSAALEGLATRSLIPVQIGQLPPGRLPAPVETSAYFVVAEALTNAAKHARCSLVQIGVRVENGSATVEVHDDGVGGAAPSAGSGLRGLADRVNALGGRLEIESPAGKGTTVRARIALGAPEVDRCAVRLGPGANAS